MLDDEVKGPAPARATAGSIAASCQLWQPVAVGRILRSVLRVVIELADTHQRQPEISEPLQQTEQRRLVSNLAHQHRVPVIVRQRHALKQRAELITQFTLGLEPIRPWTHRDTLPHPRSGLADDRHDHMGEMTSPRSALSICQPIAPITLPRRTVSNRYRTSDPIDKVRITPSRFDLLAVYGRSVHGKSTAR
jgi:hypothetical protein